MEERLRNGADQEYNESPEAIVKKRNAIGSAIEELFELLGESGASSDIETGQAAEDFSKQFEVANGKSFGDHDQLTFELYRGGTFKINTDLGYIVQESNSYRDSAIIRSTKPLPTTYKISVTVGEIEYDLSNIAGLNKDPEYDEGKTEPPTTETTESMENLVEADTSEQTKTETEQPESSTNETDLSNLKLDSKIEELGKRLQERVSRLKNLASTPTDLPEDACKSCEGKGECYWCKNSGKCSKCSGTGKTEDGSECETCKGTGVCHSCNGSGKCHWCNGTGIKKG